MFWGRKEAENPQWKRGKTHQLLPLRPQKQSKEAGGWEVWQTQVPVHEDTEREITSSFHTARGTRHQQLSDTTNLIRIWTNDLHPITNPHEPFRSLREIQGLAIPAPEVAQTTMTLHKHEGCGDLLTGKQFQTQGQCLMHRCLFRSSGTMAKFANTVSQKRVKWHLEAP